MEAKATNEVGKTDIALFELKLTDYYFGRWERVGNHAWFRSSPLPAQSARAHAASPPTARSSSATPRGSPTCPLPPRHPHRDARPTTRRPAPGARPASAPRHRPASAAIPGQGRPRWTPAPTKALHQRRDRRSPLHPRRAHRQRLGSLRPASLWPARGESSPPAASSLARPHLDMDTARAQRMRTASGSPARGPDQKQ